MIASSSIIRLTTLISGLLVTLSAFFVVGAAVVGATKVFDKGVIAFVRECAFVTDGLYQVDVAHRIEHRIDDQYSRILSLSYSPDGS